MARSMVTRRSAETVTDGIEVDGVEVEAQEETSTPRTRKGSRSSRVAEAAKAGAGGGWGAYAKVKETAKKANFNSESQLKIEEDTPTLIKFLQDSPFETYWQHWVQRGKGKKRSWTCPDTDSCGLCAVGHPVRFLALFNVVLIDGATHTQKYWTAGKLVSDLIEEMANSKRHSPINDGDLYFEVVRKEADFGYKYTLNPLRGSELEDAEVVSDTEEAGFLGSLFESDKTTVDPVDLAGMEEVVNELIAKGDK